MTHAGRFRTAGARARVVVLLSGGGSNLQALLDATGQSATDETATDETAACQQATGQHTDSAGSNYPVDIVAVGADRPHAGGLARAEQAGIPTFVERVADHSDRAAWDRALTDRVASYDPDLVVSAGFLKLAGPAFLSAFAGRFLNTHNSLLPSFAGMNGPADALAYGVKLAGATLFAVDEGVDTGPIIAQVAVPVEPTDSVASLTERIKQAERTQLVDMLGRMARDGWTISGRTVSIP